MSPAEATSATLYAGWLSDGTETLDGGGLVISAPAMVGPDIANGPLIVPPGIGTATGPLYVPSTFRGRSCWRSNGTTSALALSGLVMPPAGGGAYTIVQLLRRTDTSTGRMCGAANDRPFFSANGEDTVSWAADGAPGTAGVVNVDGLMGPSMIVGTFNPTTDLQKLYIDAPAPLYIKKIGETANTDPGTSLNGTTYGICYNGHPTVGGNYWPGDTAGKLIFRGEMSEPDLAMLGEWWSRYQAPRRGPVLLVWRGQSNEQADQYANNPRRVVRRDVTALRDNAKISGDVREQQARGPMNDTFLSGSLRGADIEVVYRLMDDYGIDVDVVNVTRSGTGFRDPSTGALDPLGWASPTTYGGDGAVLWQRYRAAMDEMLAARNYAHIHDHFGAKETDGIHATSAAAFEDSLDALFEDSESAYGGGASHSHSVPLIHPDVTVAHRATIRAGQEAVVAAASNRYGLNSDAQSIRVDGLHYEPPYHDDLGAQDAALINSLVL